MAVIDHEVGTGVHRRVGVVIVLDHHVVNRPDRADRSASRVQHIDTLAIIAGVGQRWSGADWDRGADTLVHGVDHRNIVAVAVHYIELLTVRGLCQRPRCGARYPDLGREHTGGRGRGTDSVHRVVGLQRIGIGEFPGVGNIHRAIFGAVYIYR